MLFTLRTRGKSRLVIRETREAKRLRFARAPFAPLRTEKRIPEPPELCVKARRTQGSTPSPVQPPPEAQNAPKEATGPKVLDQNHHDPAKQLPLRPLVTRIVALAQTLAEKKFYPYQVELVFRIVESLLFHDGDVLTCLMSRQMGKTEAVGSIASAIAMILPDLAKKYPDDWRLNITDDNGVYRGYRDGIKIGIYAPKQEQASILFERAKKALTSDTAKQVLKELHLAFDVRNGNTLKLSNGSRIICESASEQAKIEGETHHLLILEETQEIGDLKIRKSLHPMVAATMGTIVKIGTATTYRCDFYDSIKLNEQLQMDEQKKKHFFYPYTVGIQYNSLYRKYIEKERQRLGEDSDEFQTSYCGNWIFERGMFVTLEQLFNVKIAKMGGDWSVLYPNGRLPRQYRHYSIVAGIDWGSSHDSTVVTLVAVDWNTPSFSTTVELDGQQKSYVCYDKHIIGWLEFAGDNYEYQFNEIQNFLARIPKLKKIVTDSNTCGKPIFDRLNTVFGSRISVEPFNFQAKVKSDGYRELYADICGGRLTFPASAPVRSTREYYKFTRQMLDLKKEYKNNLMCVAHPDVKGAHDDYPDSLMLANHGANTPNTVSGLELLSTNPLYN